MLVDTSVLVRTLQPRHVLNSVAQAAIASLRLQKRRLYIVPQNLMELWTVATRPAGDNGLGWSTETPAFYSVWKQLVIEHEVSGKPAHDARLVAAMRVYGITSILTFDKAGFSRYPGIDPVHPADVAASV